MMQTVCANFGKKGQMKIQQMAFMLIAITLFFMLAGLFFLTINLAGLKESAETLDEENAQLLITKLANSPEFSCGDAFDNPGTNCLDMDKVMILKENIEKYEGFWGNDITNIEIRKVYPLSEGDECNLGNYPNCDYIRVISSDVEGFYNSNFVSICRKALGDGEVYDKCELGRLMISYNQEE